MSKHLGNVLEPISLMDAKGADALRWFFLASGSPWSARKIDPGVLDEIVRKVLLTYWNTASFLVLYANAAAAQNDAWYVERKLEAAATAARPVLDRWVISELHALVRDVTAAMEEFDAATAGRRIAGFIDDVSNWYVRRSRRRFWEGPGTPGGSAAFATLHECLETLTRLMAPLTPFLTDYVWAVLRGAGTPDSVHLAAWPVFDPGLVDGELSAQMALARRLVELGRSARSSAAVRTRQPLGRALVSAAGFGELPAELRAQVTEELNIRSLEAMDPAGGELTDYAVKPSYRALGQRFGPSTPAVAAAITAADPAELAAGLAASGTVTVLVDGSPVIIEAGDVIVTQTPRHGWAVAAVGGETVALELAITPELRREGLAREVVRLVQDTRKGDGLQVSDRISVRWHTADEELARALTEHGELISAEVLAGSFRPSAEAGEPGGAGEREHTDPNLGLTFWLQRA
jgi:isoleucyl-tRNA synthetase